MKAALKSDRGRVRSKTEAVARGMDGRLINRPKANEKHDEKYGSDDHRQGSGARRRGKGRAGILAALHMVRRQIMFDLMRDQAQLGDQQKGRENPQHTIGRAGKRKPGRSNRKLSNRKFRPV
jgi:hypothetical protein